MPETTSREHKKEKHRDLEDIQRDLDKLEAELADILSNKNEETDDE